MRNWKIYLASTLSSVSSLFLMLGTVLPWYRYIGDSPEGNGYEHSDQGLLWGEEANLMAVLLIFVAIFVLIPLFVSLFMTFNWRSRGRSEAKLLIFNIVPIGSMLLLLMVYAGVGYRFVGAGYPLLETDSMIAYTILVLSLLLTSFIAVFFQYQAFIIRRYAYSDPYRLPLKIPSIVLAGASVALPFFAPLYVLVFSDYMIEPFGPFFVVVASITNVFVLLLVIFSRSFRKGVLSACELEERGDHENALKMYRKAGMFLRSGNLLQKLHRFEEAAQDHEKEGQWNRARSARIPITSPTIISATNDLRPSERISWMRKLPALLSLSCMVIVLVTFLSLTPTSGWISCEHEFKMESRNIEDGTTVVTVRNSINLISSDESMAVEYYDDSGERVDGPTENVDYVPERYLEDYRIIMVVFWTFVIVSALVFILSMFFTLLGRMNGVLPLVLGILHLLFILSFVIMMFAIQMDGFWYELSDDYHIDHGMLGPQFIAIAGTLVLVLFSSITVVFSKNTHKHLTLGRDLALSMNLPGAVHHFKKAGMPRTAEHLSSIARSPVVLRKQVHAPPQASFPVGNGVQYKRPPSGPL